MSVTTSGATAAREPVRVPLWVVTAGFWLVVALVLAARSAGLADVPAVTTLGVIFTSIVVEALPFILVGAIVSAAIAVWVPDGVFSRLARLPRALQLPGAAVAGVGMPVCECGSVPVARRLLARGIDPAAGVAFMLAAPILNPIVLASTWVAYDGRGDALEMTAARAGLGLLIAIAAGWLIGRRADGSVLRGGGGDADEHSHDHGSGAGGLLSAFTHHLAADFFFMGKFLVLGAAAAAVMQTLLPQSLISGIGEEVVIASLVMIAVAFALSLCSEADAFVAVSFTAFPLGSQLAFLVAGPMLDTKLAVLYSATFKRDFLVKLAAVAVPLTVAGAVVFQALV